MRRRYVATRGVAWPGNDREAGQDVSDAPQRAIADWLACGAVQEVEVPRGKK